jgi:hypothetical protein
MDAQGSPFNVAKRILLHDFTLREVEVLNRRHSSPLNETQVIRLTRLLGGHPFLTRLALELLAAQRYDFERLMAAALSEEGPFADHLAYYWRLFMEDVQIKTALRQIRQTRIHDRDKTYYRLKGTGLIKQKGAEVIMRNDLYDRFFEERLHG